MSCPLLMCTPRGAQHMRLHRHAAELVDAAADLDRRQFAAAQHLAHLFGALLVKALVLLEFLGHIAEHLRGRAEVLLHDGAHLLGAHSGALLGKQLPVLPVHRVADLPRPAAARQKRHVEIAAVDAPVLAQRVAQPRKTLLRLVLVLAPAHGALAAPGADLLRRAPVDARQVVRRRVLQLFRDLVHRVGRAAHRVRRIAQPEDHILAQRIARQLVPAHGEEVRKPPALRQKHVEDGRGRHLDRAVKGLHCAADLQRGDAVGDDERHRHGDLPERRKDARHQAAEAVRPGEVGEPGGRKPLHGAGRDAGHRAARKPAVPRTDEDRQHDQHAADRDAGDRQPGEREQQNAERDDDRRHVAAVEHGALPPRLNQPHGAPQEIRGAAGEERLGDVHGRHIGERAVDQHHCDARREQRQKRRGRRKDRVLAHRFQLGERPADRADGEQRRDVPRGHVDRRRDQVADCAAEDHRPHRRERRRGRGGRRKRRVLAENEPPRREEARKRRNAQQNRPSAHTAPKAPRAACPAPAAKCFLPYSYVLFLSFGCARRTPLIPVTYRHL